MQTNLEKKGVERRKELTGAERYNKKDEYSINHKDALSDGDVLGKGTGNGGHIHTTPNHDRVSAIDYANFKTTGGGGQYDIEGRNGRGGREFLQTISLYGPKNEYGAHLIDTSANLADGQIVI